MIVFPAIDLLDGCAVRLFQGDYEKKTVYGSDVPTIAAELEKIGATHLHLVDLDGAKSGSTTNFETVEKIRKNCSMFIEIGGGIRNMETVKKYLDIGIDRVILGTAALHDEKFLYSCVDKYREKTAVGVDMADGKVTVNGWLEKSDTDGEQFCKHLRDVGVDCVICTDISRDGAMQGTNRELYKRLSQLDGIKITASGGVSGIDDVIALRKMNLYGCIIGKAYYTGAIDLKQALEAAK